MGRYAIRFSVWTNGEFVGHMTTTLSAISKDHAVEKAHERLDMDGPDDTELVFDAAQYLGPDRNFQTDTKA
jgi:hypothetical protein